MRHFIIFVLLLSSVNLFAGESAFFYVANSDDRTFCTYDYAMSQIVFTDTIKGRPSSVDCNIYIALTLIDSNELMCISREDRSSVHYVPVGKNPTYVISDRKCRYIYVSNSGDSSISIIDHATLSVIKTLAVGQEPSGMAISEKDSMLAVVNARSNSISLYENYGFGPAKTFMVGKNPTRATFDKTRSILYVTLSGEDSLGMLNYRADKVTKIWTGKKPFDVLLTPGGNVLYVSILGTEDKPGNVVNKYRTKDMKLITRIICGKGCSGLAYSPRIGLVVANYYTNTVTIIGADGGKHTETVGKHPLSISFYE